MNAKKTTLTEHQFHAVWTEAVGREGYDKNMFLEILLKLKEDGRITQSTSPPLSDEEIDAKIDHMYKTLTHFDLKHRDGVAHGIRLCAKWARDQQTPKTTNARFRI